MIRIYSPFFTLILLAAILVQPVSAEDPVQLTLWFDQPATDWEREGLPIGNGAMGAVVFGGPAKDIIQFNEKTLWTGGPGSTDGYDFGLPEEPQTEALQKIRKQLAEQSQLTPKEVAEALGRDPKGYGNYQTFGDLVLDFESGPPMESVQNYRRELDIERAVARVSFEHDGVGYVREYFASYPAGVVVVKISADQPGKISFTSRLEIPENRSAKIQIQGGRIRAAGRLNDNQLKYETQLQVAQQGGVLDSKDAAVSVANADSAVLILTAGTNYAQEYPGYRGEDPHAAIEARIKNASEKTYAELLAEHEQDYRALFSRVDLDIGQKMPDVPTPQLLNDHVGKDTPEGRALEALYFQYGRYLLIASSRPGSLPANLQGVWNHSNTPPWNADYHVNINLQMNYWPADITNLSETALPLFTFVESLVEPGRESAQKIMGADGWTLFLNTNIWGFTGLISWPTAFWQPEAGAWLAQHFYDHYRFTQDEAFLRERAYPVMKEAAQFWLDALVEDSRDGSLVVSPSYSPEHGNFTVGASMSQQLVFDLFTNTQSAAQHLGDKKFQRQLRAALKRLDPGIRVGSWGQLQEWKEDLDDPKSEHRHVSHLFALHPGRQISVTENPELTEAVKTSLNARGDHGTGWAKAWKINLWARLLDGDRAHKLLVEQLQGSTLPNLWDTHPPFQIDGNFGATAGIAEMLLQSHGDEIHLLPALPNSWSNGKVTGLRARGDNTINMKWADGKLVEAIISAGQSAPINLRASLFNKEFSLVDTVTNKPVRLKGKGEQRTFTAKAGSKYRLVKKQSS